MKSKSERGGSAEGPRCSKKSEKKQRKALKHKGRPKKGKREGGGGKKEVVPAAWDLATGLKRTRQFVISKKAQTKRDAAARYEQGESDRTHHPPTKTLRKRSLEKEDGTVGNR